MSSDSLNTHITITCIIVPETAFLAFEFNPCPWGNHWFDFCQHVLVLPVLELYKNESYSVYSFVSASFAQHIYDEYLCFLGESVTDSVSLLSSILLYEYTTVCLLIIILLY